MAEWSWKQAVADQVLELVHQKLSHYFSIDEVYAQIPFFQRLFPRNRHIKEKIRQHLQRLRDDGFLLFHGGGHYELNLRFNELECQAPKTLPAGNASPAVKQVLRSIRLRDTFLAIEIKKRYEFSCQVCGQPVWLSGRKRYAEGHHLWPLGHPHLGPDVAGNIIVLCPNHHVMFDRGAITILPETLFVRHAVEGVLEKTLRLHVESWHSISRKFLQYHHEKIFAAS
jgi:hypothetical protein